MYQDERKLDFKPLGIAIKKKKLGKQKGWTQEYLAQLVDLTPRSIMGSVAKFPISSF
jgi:DNA-binding XRE family transcriptional regulator